MTAMISGIGASKNARRAALVHLYFNIIGTAVFMIVFYTINGFIHFDFLDGAASAMGIAVVHSAFNVASTILLLPFSRVLVNCHLNDPGRAGKGAGGRHRCRRRGVPSSGSPFPGDSRLCRRAVPPCDHPYGPDGQGGLFKGHGAPGLL